MTVAIEPRAELSPAQEEVVGHVGGPLLVLGGPGTGKTRALEQRYLRLASSPGLAPHRILFLCTNRRYSMEAKDRLFGELLRAELWRRSNEQYSGFDEYEARTSRDIKLFVLEPRASRAAT